MLPESSYWNERSPCWQKSPKCVTLLKQQKHKTENLHIFHKVSTWLKDHQPSLDGCWDLCAFLKGFRRWVWSSPRNCSFLQIQNDHSCRWSMCWSSVHMCSRTGPVDWPTQLIFILYFYIAGQVPHVAAMCVQFCVHYVAKIIFRLSFSQNIKELVATATDMCSKTGPTCCSHPCVFNDSSRMYTGKNDTSR